MQRFLISGLDLRIDAAIRPKQGQTVHRFSISSPDLRIGAAIRSKQGQSVHRFSISSPDLRIDAAIRSKQGQSVHRFLISGLDLRIDAAKRSKQGQSVHRFSISSLDLRIDAAKRSKQGNPSSPREDGIVPRPGNAGWAGTSDGVAARGFVNGEGACRAAVGGKAPQVRTGPKSLPAGRAGHGNSPIPRRQTRTWQHGPCPQAARPCPHHTKSPDSFLNRDP